MIKAELLCRSIRLIPRCACGVGVHRVGMRWHPGVGPRGLAVQQLTQSDASSVVPGYRAEVADDGLNAAALLNCSRILSSACFTGLRWYLSSPILAGTQLSWVAGSATAKSSFSSESAMNTPAVPWPDGCGVTFR